MSDKPWFTRIRTPASYRLEPYSPAGWIATAVFVFGALASSSILYFGHESRAAWIVWGIVLGTWTIGYLVLAFRNSTSAELLVDLAKKP